MTSAVGFSAPDSRRVTVRSWRTIRDSRSACSLMIASRRSGSLPRQLLGVGPDARQRRLEVVADAAQEVVLGGVELEELGVLRLDRGEQLGIAQRHPDLGGEHLEEVLVGALPRPHDRHVPEQDADALVAGAQVGPDRARLAGDPLLDADRGRVDEPDLGVDAGRRPRARRRPLGP